MAVAVHELGGLFLERSIAMLLAGSLELRDERLTRDGHLGRKDGGRFGVGGRRGTVGARHVARRMDAVAVAVQRAIDDVPRDAHRIDAHGDRSADLDAELDADLATAQQIVDLQRLTLGQAHVHLAPIVREARHRIRIIEAEPTPELGDGDVRP